MPTKQKEKNIKSLHKFLKRLNQENRPFFIEDVSNITNWKDVTVKTYLSKKLKVVIEKNEDGSYSVKNGIKKYNFEAFKNLMSQVQSKSQDPFNPNLKENITILIEKARESAILAVDTYNRPQTSFRTQGFSVLMIIAWTSALHAHFEMNNIDYFYKGKTGAYKIVDGEKKAWELSTCIKKCPSIKASVKNNIEFFISLRNKIEHRYCPPFDLQVIGECHALLMNFEEFLTGHFSTYYSLQSSLVIPLQLIKTREKDIIKSLKGIEKEHYNELKEFVYSFREGLPDEPLYDSSFCFRLFLIPNVGNHAKSADASIQFINENDLIGDEKEVLNRTTVINKIKNSSVINQGELKPADVLRRIRARTNKNFTMNTHTKCWKYYNVRPDRQNCQIKYCQYDEPHNDYVYTEEWVDFLVAEIRNDEKYEKIINFKIKK